MKHVNTELSGLLALILNASLDQGLFPDSLKLAKVIPIFKNGKKHEVSNYRPISLLSVFSKLYEKVMHSRILNFFNSNGCIYQRQYGFRPNHSCEHALLDAQSTIHNTLNKKQISLLLLIDFSKAFDMVDHSILLDKLYKYGIRGVAHNWFKTYLSGRNQYVTVNNIKSTINTLQHGVPQGSILGPLLFIIYINDISAIDKTIDFILYADDANILISGSTIQEIFEKLQIFLPKLEDWVNINSLKLNTTKTKYMIFSNTPGINNISFKINNVLIERKVEDKFLGVLIDEKLNFTGHKAAIATKISRNCGVLYRARHVLNEKSLKSLYYSFIQSHLNYCSSVWGLGHKNSLRSIFIAQKRAIRTIFFVKLYTKNETSGEYSYGNTKPFFSTSKILTVHNLILHQALNLMHKIFIGLAPAPILAIFSTEKPVPVNITITKSLSLLRKGIEPSNILAHPLENTHKQFFTTPNKRLAIEKNSISTLGPKMFNYFVNTINLAHASSGKQKLKIEKLTPTTFKNYIKEKLIETQGSNDPVNWDPTNFPIYTISSTTVTLRSATFNS